MGKYDTPYKAIGAGVSGFVFATFLPWVLGHLDLVQAAAANINPLLGGLVGLGAMVVTWFTPKNTAPKP